MVYKPQADLWKSNLHVLIKIEPLKEMSFISSWYSAPSHSLPDPHHLLPWESFSFAPSTGPFQCLKDLKIHPISLRYSSDLSLQVPSSTKISLSKPWGKVGDAESQLPCTCAELNLGESLGEVEKDIYCSAR